MALLITPELCFGCRACQIACKSWNNLAADKTRNYGTRENPPDLTANNLVLPESSCLGSGGKVHG
jgi:formate dehydrogenase iron-sulfur subunit